MHNTSLGGHIQAMGGVSRATADEQRADGGAGRSFANGTEQRSSILDGYQIERSEVDMVLHYDLPDSRQWKKRVWTRKSYPKKLFRWNTAEEILSYLISFDRHEEWTSTTAPQKPPSGTILFFHRKQTKNFRSDGYEWKTRKTTKAVREDRMKLKVGGYQLLYGCYAHSASNPNFHRRSYWLIQNPDLIMVHYLELDCSEGSGARASQGLLTGQNSSLELEQSIEPSNWSLLTISDCNLCALLSMVQTSDSTKALLNQLTGVLDQNVQRSSTLEEAIEMNNYGLPEDMFKDTRTRKMKGLTSFCSTCTGSTVATTTGAGGSGSGGVVKRDMEPTLQAAMTNLCGDGCHSQGESSRVIGNKVAIDLSSLAKTSLNSISTTSSSSSSSAGNSSNSAPPNGLSQEPGVLNVLSKSPHIIVCQKQGSLSYILTLPTSSNSPAAAVGSAPLPPGRMILPSPTSGSGQDASVSTKLSDLLKKSSSRNKSLAKKPDKVGGKGGMGGKSHLNGSTFSSEVIKDYDAEKFSQFASILVNMDGIGGLRLAESEREDMDHRSLGQQSRTRSLTESISDAEFTDSLESESSTTQQVEAGDDEHQEVMDFASIVSSAVAVESSPDTPSKRDHDTGVLSLIPEVPMSWLNVQSASHQGVSEEPKQIHSSPLSLTTAATTTATTTATPAPDTIQGTGSQGNVQLALPLPPPTPSPSVAKTTNDTSLRVLSSSLLLPHKGSSSNGNIHCQVENRMSDGDTQVCVQVADQPMAEVESLDEQSRHNTSDDFLDVSLDLDAESLQQLLSFSHSPEPHRTLTSNYQQLQPAVSAADTSPLSPISQLFDRLEPPTSTSPIHSSLTDLHAVHGPGHSHNPGPSSSQMSNVESGATAYAPHNNQSPVTPVGLSVCATTPQALVTSSPWAPSPNSLQLWLESTSGAYEGVLPSTSSESTSTVLASSHSQTQAMDVDNTSGLTTVDLPQDLCDFITQSDLPQLSSSTDNRSSQLQYTQPRSNLQGSNLSFDGRNIFHSHSSSLSECDFNTSHVSDQNQNALFDSTEDFPGPFDVFRAHPNPSLCSYPGETSTHNQVQRKSSNTSIRSEPLSFDSLQVPQTMFSASDSSYHRLSLPNLTTYDSNDQGQSASLMDPASQGPGAAMSPIQSGSGGFTSSPCSHRSLSPGVALPDIPEGVQLHSQSPLVQFDPGQFNVDLLHYRTSSPVPSSPSIASVSSRSTVSTHEFFESDSPSVLELCEMLSESPNVRHQDFSHMVLSESEQQQLFRSAQVIQNAFRKYKSRRQMRDREKSAALLIENYYKNYVQMKHEKDKAARRIQQQYRIYKSRTKELNRAAVFIQQMYRYQKHRKHPDSGQTSSSNSYSSVHPPPQRDQT